MIASKIGPPPLRRQFASDNYAGICPEAWDALAEANCGHARAYGEDEWTVLACDMLRELFEADCDAYFVFNGTAANSLALASLCQSYHSVLCHETSHVETDECGAPEFYSNGTKLLLLLGELGKVTPTDIEQMVKRRSDIHYPKPRVVTLTQATELGTVYSLPELASIRETARELNLAIHMDGARLANASVELDASPADIVRASGMDVLCLGGTKNGLSYAEAVIFFNQSLATEFDYRCKQAGQLASKMRFISAQWVGILRDRAWLKHARHANEMATLLEKRLRNIPCLQILYPRQANAVFVRMPANTIRKMRDRGWIFYDFIGNACRLMCSWDTTEEDVNAFVADMNLVSE